MVANSVTNGLLLSYALLICIPIRMTSTTCADPTRQETGEVLIIPQDNPTQSDPQTREHPVAIRHDGQATAKIEDGTENID